jgi:hypothetical protein
LTFFFFFLAGIRTPAPNATSFSILYGSGIISSLSMLMKLFPGYV